MLCLAAQLCLTLYSPMDCSTPGSPVHHQLRSSLKLMSIELAMPSSHLIILCPPLLLLPSNFPNIRVFSNETVLPIRWPKYWSFSFRLFATLWIVACQDSPGKSTGVGCHALLQGILATQGSNPVLLHCGWILYCLSHQGSPRQVVLFQFSSVQYSCSVMSDSLGPHF